jgi:hypothetical protein
MSVVAILVILLLTLALSVVFYAFQVAAPLAVKTALAAAGFLLLFLTLFFSGGVPHA